MKRLRPYVKGYLKETILGPLFKLLEALFELLVPLLIANLIDVQIGQRNSQGILGVVLTLFALAVVGLAFSMSYVVVCDNGGHLIGACFWHFSFFKPALSCDSSGNGPLSSSNQSAIARDSGN